MSPPALKPDAFSGALARALDAGDVACFLLALDGAGDDVWRRACERLVPLTHSRGAAFLLKDRAPLVADTGADGVHVEGPVRPARGRLPPDAILGAGCGLSRHAAMLAGEAGADYVAFGPWGRDAAELLGWWQAVMEPPCVAQAAPAREAAGAGADFVMLDRSVWTRPDTVAETVREAADAVANPPAR